VDTSTDNRPRPYSTLRDGRIVWVTPEEHAAGGRARRAHLETDDEVLRRIRGAGRGAVANCTAKCLDKTLEYWSMPPRQYVDGPV
jgi:hypothetical protein